MPLRAIPVNAIQPSDLQRLIDNGVMEDKRLDYKEALPGNSLDEKKELLADISALANTLGGDILFGIAEQRDTNGRSTGIPEKTIGIPNLNWDTERLRLEQIIRDGLAPRIQGVEIAKIDQPTGDPIIIIRVPASFQAPHIITFQQRSPFFQRNPGGKSPMDVWEIRQAFLRSASWIEQAETFRQERVKAVVSDSFPVNMEKGPKLLLHVVPLRAEPFALDFSDARLQNKLLRLQPLIPLGFNFRLNFDGQLNYASSEREQGMSQSYVQIYRNGTLEFCDTTFLRPKNRNGVQENSIWPEGFEERIIERLNSGIKLLEQLNIVLPLVVFMTLYGVKDYIIDTGNFIPHETFPIDREEVFPPGQLVERWEQRADHILKPIFDTIWNSAGFQKSLFYNDKGDWVKPRR